MRPRKARRSQKPAVGSQEMQALREEDNLSLPDPIYPKQGNPQAAWYGAVTYYGSILLFLTYLAWAFLPQNHLERLGIYWYPKREWALLIPAWICMAVVFTYLFYAAINIHDTPAAGALAHLVDAQGHIQDYDPTSSQPHPLVKNSYAHLPEGAIPALCDMPIGVVNQVLFGSDSDTAHSAELDTH